MFDKLLVVNGKELNKKYIESLNKQDRLDLIDPIFNELRKMGWIWMDDSKKVNSEYKKLVEYNPDVNTNEVFNNSSLATNICKYFCHSFYLTTETGKNTIIDNFNDDKILKRIIHNRLGLDWLDDDEKGKGVNEAFNLSFKMMIQGQRSMRLVNATSMFKPSIAKYMYMKYSNEGDTVFDYSCGFGGRLLGAVSSKRKYIGTDPLTTEELEVMAKHLKLTDYTLIKSGSEDYRGDENSIDFCFSSPPYFNQEVYSEDLTQAYNKGEDYFYNVYWRGTLDNVRYMLKPGKWFGLNITDKYPKMLEIAKEYFGEVVEVVKLRTVRSHLTKAAGVQKFEPIHMFRNMR